MKKIAMGNDHSAVEMKEAIKAYVEQKGYEVIDFGTNSSESCDYPVFGEKVGRAVADGEADLGIAICGTGVGISLAANKVKGIRCALCHDCFSAKATRLHNNANMLAMGAGVIGPNLAREVVDIFLNTPFSDEERHNRRIALIEKL